MKMATVGGCASFTFQFRLESLSLEMGRTLFGDEINWGGPDWDGFEDPKGFLLFLDWQ
jgi:hypothetical protein